MTVAFSPRLSPFETDFGGIRAIVATTTLSDRTTLILAFSSDCELFKRVRFKSALHSAH